MIFLILFHTIYELLQIPNSENNLKVPRISDSMQREYFR